MIYIFVLMVISGVIAYMGDALGTWVGKKRLTVFGLRPRITALVVAISTGILITLLTLGVATILSEDVRTALFSMDTLRQDIDKLQAETRGLEQTRNRLEQEKKDLAEDVKRLTSQVRIKETESVVFRKDEPLSVCVISTGRRPEEVMKELTTLIINLTDKVRRRGVKVKDEIEFFTENKEQLNLMAAHIASSSQDLVVGAVAAENINTGEELGNVRFLVLPNNLIFNRNQEIASIEIDGSNDRGQIARALKEFMDEMNHEVVKLGMIANPLTGRFGDISSDSMISFFDMVNRIRELNRKIILVAVVPEDTYAIGPLNVTFRFEETGESVYSTGGNE
ncbi:MAG: DUF3084 domain-containing protein [Candidatus Riflebacteria bacterium]|jgi:uncharacterized protein (DUF3084 family)|nr:DUF3084 domain-containing protein [Candidatus Riflebacteria bacterium]